MESTLNSFSRLIPYLAQNNRTFLSEKPLVTSGKFCLRISLTCLYVLLSSMRFLITVTFLSIYSAIFVSWLVGQSIQKKNKWREMVDMCQSVEFETAFKYSLKTPFIFKGSFFELMRTLLPTIKRYLFCSFDRNVFDCRKGTFFALLKRSLQTEKRYLFCALKFCLVKWEMHEKWTILTSKYFHLKALNTRLFSLKRYPFLTFRPID